MTKPRFILSLVVVLVLSVSPSWSAPEVPSEGDVLHPGVPLNLHWSIGLEGGPNLSLYSDEPFLFSCIYPYFLPDSHAYFTRSFQRGSGVGFHIGAHAGLVVEQLVGCTVGLKYDSRHASFSSEQYLQCVQRGTRKIDSVLISDVASMTIGVLSLEVQAKILVTPNLYLQGGVGIGTVVSRSWTLREELGKMKNGLFPRCYYTNFYRDTVSSPVLEANGSSLANTMPTQWDIRLGIGYEYALTEDWVLEPSVHVGIPLTEILTALPWQEMRAPQDVGVYNGTNSLGEELHYSPKTVVVYPSVGISYRVR
jgi:hypothetical protein